MYTKRFLFIAIVSFALLFNITSCADDNSTGSDGEPPESKATVNGMIENEFSKTVVGKQTKVPDNTVASAATITSSGSVSLVENTETEVEASGEFSVDVDVSTAEEVVIVAESSGERLMGYISAEVDNGNSYTIKPINTESSAETNVYSEIKAGGNIELVHKSDIESVITGEGASEIYGDATATSDIAAAVSNIAQSRSEFFAEFTGSAGSNIESYFETMTAVQSDYEMALNAGTSNDQAEAAYQAFLEGKVDAYGEAGLETKENAEFLHLQGTLIKNSLNSVSASAENGARASSSYMIAVATDLAVRARAESSGMDESTIRAITDAGSSLKADIWLSNGSESTVEAAFESYHDDVRAAIESDSSVEGSVVVTIDAEINAALGPKSTFNTAISGVVGTMQLINAYTAFDNSVEAIVDANSTLAGNIDAEILADIMVLINLSS